MKKMCKFVIFLVSLIILGVVMCIFMNLYKGQAVAIGLAWLPEWCVRSAFIYKKINYIVK